MNGVMFIMVSAIYILKEDMGMQWVVLVMWREG